MRVHGHGQRRRAGDARQGAQEFGQLGRQQPGAAQLARNGEAEEPMLAQQRHVVGDICLRLIAALLRCLQARASSASVVRQLKVVSETRRGTVATDIETSFDWHSLCKSLCRRGPIDNDRKAGFPCRNAGCPGGHAARRAADRRRVLQRPLYGAVRHQVDQALRPGHADGAPAARQRLSPAHGRDLHVRAGKRHPAPAHRRRSSPDSVRQ